MTLRDRKRTLRDSMLVTRDAIDSDVRSAASRAIATRIESLDAYRQATVLGPLGMTDTSYLVPAAKYRRVVAVNARSSSITTASDSPP